MFLNACLNQTQTRPKSICNYYIFRDEKEVQSLGSVDLQVPRFVFLNCLLTTSSLTCKYGLNSDLINWFPSISNISHILLYLLSLLESKFERNYYSVNCQAMLNLTESRVTDICRRACYTVILVIQILHITQWARTR